MLRLKWPVTRARPYTATTTEKLAHMAHLSTPLRKLAQPTIYRPLICRRLFERNLVEKGARRCVLDSTDLVGAFHAIETREEQTHRVGEVG